MNTVLVEKNLSTGQSLQLVQGDITVEDVDVIVNAANEHLQHGGGVASAISKKGGPGIQMESGEWIRKNGLVSPGHPAWTSGGLLPAKYVIHAVGPVWGNVSEDAKLTDAQFGSLRLLTELNFCAITTPA